MEQFNKLVEAIYTDPRIREFIGKLHPEDLREDLLHHFIERLYTYEERHPGKLFILAAKDKVFCKYVEGNESKEQQLFAWVVGNIRMELTSPRSPFARKYRRKFSELPAWLKQIADNGTCEPDYDEISRKLIEMGGEGFLKGVAAEIEKQESKRLKNFDRPNDIGAVLQITLW